MKFKFGIESVELSINKEEIKTPELAVESISDIDLNSMSLDCMNALAGFESAVLEVVNLYNMQEIVGTEADGEGLSARIKNAVARAVKALWNWMKKVFNFISGLFRKNKTTEILVAEVVVANEVPKIFKEVSEEMKKVAANAVEDLEKTKNDVASSIAERHKKLREMINNIGKNTDSKVADYIDKTIKENEKVISEIVDKKVDKVAKAAVEEVAKNPEKTTFTYSIKVPVFNSELISNNTVDIIIVQSKLTKDAESGAGEYNINSYSGITKLLSTFATFKKLFGDSSLDKYIKDLRENSISYNNAQEFSEKVENLQSMFPSYEIKNFTVEVKIDEGGDEKVYSNIYDAVNKASNEAVFITSVMTRTAEAIQNILNKGDMNFEFVNEIKDEERAKKAMLLVKSIKKFTTMINKEAVDITKINRGISNDLHNIRQDMYEKLGK